MNRSHRNAWVLTGSLLSAWLCAPPIAAQVLPDNTLPVGERSQVTGNPIVQIDGGARRGSNLFHSFSQFSIPTGGSAFFNNAADVQNIFGRVTGGSSSNIDGVIRANGTANLFLLNPNGILFGPNASLNIGGSFVATTANAIGFPNGEVFSSDAIQPLPSQLLTVNPNAFFFNQLIPQPITVQSRYSDRVLSSTSFNATGFHVPPGQNLVLVGGSIQLNSGEPFVRTSPPKRPLLAYFYPYRQNVPPDGGWLISPGSHVELGAIGGAGTVGLSTTSSNWQLTIPNGVPRANVSLSNGSGIYTLGAGGSIRVLAHNIDISNSLIDMGIARDVQLTTQGGELEVEATGAITINDSWLINLLLSNGAVGSINLRAGDRISLDNTWVNTGVDSYNGEKPRGIIGNAGDINIMARSLFLTNGSILRSEAALQKGQGNAGSVNLTAQDTVSFDNSSASNFQYFSFGNAGSINVTTGSLFLTNRSDMRSFTLGQGNAGSININAQAAVSLMQESAVGSNTIGQGNAGDVNITAGGNLSLQQSSGLTSAAFDQGNAGTVNIMAGNTISLDNLSVISTTANAPLNQFRKVQEGNAGAITITTGSLMLTNGGTLSSNTTARGNAGSVTIKARDRVLIDGVGYVVAPGYSSPSSIFTGVVNDASIDPPVGQGGDVRITTGSLSLTNGGTINSTTQGRGNAGNVTIDARNAIEIRGTANTQGDPATRSYQDRLDGRSGITTAASAGSAGNGGNVGIATGSLSVSEQGTISTTAQGQGRAGNIQIQASDTVSFDSGDAISTLLSTGTGRGGDIEIGGRSLSVLNHAQLSASTAGNGNAGNITASADTVNVNSDGRLLTTTSSNGRAGDITVKTPNLQLSGATSGLFTGTTSAGDAGNLTIQPRGNGQSVRVNLQDGAQISASTSNSGRGGQLTIAAPESITLTGDGSIIAAGTGGSGVGGNLNLTTGTLNIQNRAGVTVSSSGSGSAGNLFVDADRILLNNQGSIRADTTGGGGNINLRSPFILLRNSSNITTNATGANIPGGNIAIATQFLIAVPKEDSNISANSEDFRGGNVSIKAFSIFGIQPRPTPTPLSDITATGATSTLNGTIDVTLTGIDPTAGLVALPTDLVDASGLIAQGCPANRGNSFVISGRGGLPPTPEQQLDDDAEWSDRRRLTVTQQTSNGRGVRSQESGVRINSERKTLPDTRHPTPDTPIIEATGWQVTPTGAVILVATTPNPTVQNPLSQAIACPVRQ